MTVGEKIKKRRIEKGYSQDTLAEKVQTSRQTIYHWENDITVPNINDIQHLSHALDVDHDYFFNTDSDKPLSSTDEVVSEIYQKVKKHWRKIYIYFFVGGALMIGMGLLTRILTNVFFSNMPTMPGSSIQSTGEKIFLIFSKIDFGLGIILLIVGLIFLFKDLQKQKQYR